MRFRHALVICLSIALGALASADYDGSAFSSHDELWAWGLNNAGQLGLVDLEKRSKPALVSVIQGKRVTDIAVGGSDQKESHVLALMSPRKLYSTGDNSQGQLGLGDNLDREGLSPVPKVFSHEFAQIASGEAHSVAVTTSGEVYVWGSNQRGQLGLGSAFGSQVTIPEKLEFATSGEGEDRVVGVACGAWHSMAWLENADLYAWGDNSFGQLGTGDSKPAQGMVRVRLPSSRKSEIKSIVSGGFHNLLLDQNGLVYSWGKNNFGQLGLGKDVGHMVYQPVLVKALQGDFLVEKVVAGQAFTLAMTSKGEVYGFGDNSALQLGSSAASPTQLEPKILQLGQKFADVACGKLHCLGVAKDGSVFAWGTDSYGQLGLGSSKRSHAAAKPEKIAKLKGIKKVFASATGSYAVSARGELYSWGKNNAGQLGLRSTKNPKSSPQIAVKTSEETRVRSLSAGGHAFQYEAHSAAIVSNQEVYTWGWNIFAQLGNGGTEARQGIPKMIPWLARLNLTSIVCGQFSTGAVTEDGDLYMWGSNEAGQLGRGDFSASPSDPTRVTIDGRVQSVAIGYGHVLALTKDGRVFAWGKNFYGQLGVGDHRDKSAPQLVSHLEEERIVEVQAGQYHSLARTEAGAVFAWGYNRDYELGLNDNMDRVLPQDIATLKGRKVAQISAGNYHNLALTEDGSVLSWGLSNYGQLGRAVNKHGKFPGSVAITTGLSGGKQGGRHLKAKKVAAGGWHSLAIVDSGQVYAWGRCHFGQVGSKCDDHGTQGIQQFPMRITELEDKRVVDIAAGAGHSMAVTRQD